MSGRRGRGRRRKSGSKGNSKQAKQFFGDAELQHERVSATVTDQPTAIVHSLGRPPLAGQETVAEHYFEAVYQRAVMLGSALAHAGELLEEDDADS